MSNSKIEFAVSSKEAYDKLMDELHALGYKWASGQDMKEFLPPTLAASPIFTDMYVSVNIDRKKVAYGTGIPYGSQEFTEFDSLAGSYGGKVFCLRAVTGVASLQEKVRKLEKHIAELEREKLPKYTVVLPNPNAHKNAQVIALCRSTDNKLHIAKVKKDKFELQRYAAYALTEEEIKQDFAWAWQFAQEVK